MPWLLGSTIVGTEFKMRDRLADAGFEVLVPTYAKKIFHRRVRHPRIVTRPLLPRYLMIAMANVAEDRQRMQTTLVHLMRRGSGEYLIIPPADIEVLRQRQASGEWDQVVANGTSCTLKIGDMVAFVDGSVLAGWRGRITSKYNGRGFRVDIGGRIEVIARSDQLQHGEAGEDEAP
jgi:hypothetical protein